jgi:hypothetical protein
MGRTVAVKASDAKSAVEGGKFKPYPEGEYIAEIIDVEDAEVKNGKDKGRPTIKVTLRFTDENEINVGKKYIEWGLPLFGAWASGKSAFLFYQFFKALGVEFPAEGEGDVELPDNDELLGETIGVRLTIVDSNKLDPDFPPEDEVYLKQNKTGGYFDPARGIKSAPKAASDSAAPAESDFAL